MFRMVLSRWSSLTSRWACSEVSRWWLRFVARVKPDQKQVDLTKVKGDLDRVQGQIDSLLSGLEAKDTERFRLAQVEVSLAVRPKEASGWRLRECRLG